MSSSAQLFAYAQPSEQRVLSVDHVLADSHLSAFLDCEPGELWTRLETLRCLRRDRLPIAHSQLFLPRRYAAIADSLDALEMPSYSVVERQLGLKFARLKQENSARPLPRKVADLLQASTGSAALYVVRHYLTGADEVLFVTETFYPSGRFSFSFEMQLAD